MDKVLDKKNLYFNLSSLILLSVFISVYTNKIFLYTVKSGSMSPTIKKNSIVVVLPAKSYKVQQIVTYKKSNSTVTHRIISIMDGYLQTKGDANDSADLNLVDSKDIVGRVFLTLPFLGYLTNKYFLSAAFLILGIWYASPKFKKLF
ncbi:signal peptidase I [bacterium]|nr:signal peptidase I [bacterium]